MNHIADDVLVQIRKHACESLYYVTMLSSVQTLGFSRLGACLPCSSLFS
jgi:hypothetical protein